nr:Down syndrome cell adhesion molecule-like protein 1 homolog [Parasteatoda tepidariorum]
MVYLSILLISSLQIIFTTTQEPPILYPLSIPSDAGLGDSFDIACILKRGNIPANFEWSFNGIKPMKRLGIQINTSQKRSNYIIDSISASDVGNYSCTVSNADGSDSVSATLHVEGKTKTKLKVWDTYHHLNMFTLKLMALFLFQSFFSASSSEVPVLHPLFIPPNLGIGDGLDITCSLKRGTLPITFEWLLKNRKINNVSGIRINTSERRSVLVIQKIDVEHIGNYSCTATNINGYDTVLTHLTVEGRVFS